MTFLLILVAIGIWVGAVAWYGGRLARAGVRPGLRAFLVFLRGLALLGILILLFHPVRAHEERVRRPLHLIFFLDDSASMTLPAADGGGSRIDRARDLLFGDGRPGLVRRAARRGFEARALALSDRRYLAGPQDVSASAEVTDLAGALDWARGFAFDQDLAAVVVLSDGRQTAAGDPVRSASDTPFPVFTIGFGSTRTVNDLAVIDLSVPPRVPEDEEFDILAAVEVSGSVEGTLQGRFLVDGEPVAEAAAEVVSGSRTVRFRTRLAVGDRGPHAVTFRVDPLPDEEVLGNNERSRTVMVEKARFRVLVLPGRPGWEFKFLRRSIQAGRRLEGVYILPRSEGGTVVLADEPEDSGLPEEVPASVYPERNLESWAGILDEFDLVVVQDLAAARLGPAWEEGLEEWLDRENRSVLFLGGENAFGAGGYADSWVAPLLPVTISAGNDREEGEFTVEVPAGAAGSGSGSPFLQFDFGAVPPLRFIHRFAGVRPGSDVLLTASGRSGGSFPLFVVHRWGLGRVAAAGWDTLWRWQTLGREEGGLGRFWRTVLFSFVSGADSGPVSLSLSDEAFRAGEPIRVRMYLSAGLLGGELPERIRVFLSGEGVSERPVYLFPAADEPERYEGSFTIRTPGTYFLRYDVGGVEGRKPLVVETGSREMDSLSQDGELLFETAVAGGGEYRPAGGTGAQDPAGILDRVPFEPDYDVTVRRVFAGRLPGVILIFIALFSVEWIVRRWNMLP